MIFSGKIGKRSFPACSDLMEAPPFTAAESHLKSENVI
jgi:hypothetical protein